MNREKDEIKVIGLTCPNGHAVPDMMIRSTRKHMDCPGCGMMFPLTKEQVLAVEEWDNRREHDV